MVGKKGHACRRMHAIDLRQGVETSVRKQVEKKELFHFKSVHCAKCNKIRHERDREIDVLHASCEMKGLGGLVYTYWARCSR